MMRPLLKDYELRTKQCHASRGVQHAIMPPLFHAACTTRQDAAAFAPEAPFRRTTISRGALDARQCDFMMVILPARSAASIASRSPLRFFSAATTFAYSRAHFSAISRGFLTDYPGRWPPLSSAITASMTRELRRHFVSPLAIIAIAFRRLHATATAFRAGLLEAL